MPSDFREAVVRVVEDDREAILAFLSELVACNSFSRNKAGVDAAAGIVAKQMPACFGHETVASDEFGDHHLFRHSGAGGLPVVLAGHLDTLCPPDPAFDSLSDRGETMVGPGVNDMKGGDAVLVWALKALERCGRLEGFPATVIFNGDEELGSPDSNRLFRAMRGRASSALVFECGGPEGTVVTTRKGISRFRLSIRGRASHFGNLKGPKASAVEEMARKVLAVEALNRPGEGVSANVGRASGGLAANKVAEEAEMDYEVRAWSPEVLAETLRQLGAIAASPDVEGCSLSVERLSRRPPMQPSPASRRLFDLTVALAAELGQTVVEEKRGGVSDACWLSDAGLPTLDGLGPLGDGDFTPDEYIVKETLFQRIALTACLLAELQERGGVP